MEKIDKLVFVIWTDASDVLGWTAADEVAIETCCLIHSVGIFVAQTKDHLIIARSRNTDSEELDGTFLIPNGMVRAIVPVFC